MLIALIATVLSISIQFLSIKLPHWNNYDFFFWCGKTGNLVHGRYIRDNYNIGLMPFPQRTLNGKSSHGHTRDNNLALPSMSNFTKAGNTFFRIGVSNKSPYKLTINLYR